MLFHSTSGYVNAPKCYVYKYIACLLCYTVKRLKHRSLLRLIWTVCGVNLVLKSVHWHGGLLCRYSRNSIFWHAHDLYSYPELATTIPTAEVDGSHFGSLWYSFTIPKQFDIHSHHESVRALMVSCVTAYQCAVCTDRDLILIQMLHCASTLQRCKVAVVLWVCHYVSGWQTEQAVGLAKYMLLTRLRAVWPRNQDSISGKGWDFLSLKFCGSLSNLSVGSR
jgi:hypothetical protein